MGTSKTFRKYAKVAIKSYLTKPRRLMYLYGLLESHMLRKKLDLYFD